MDAGVGIFFFPQDVLNTRFFSLVYYSFAFIYLYFILLLPVTAILVTVLGTLI